MTSKRTRPNLGSPHFDFAGHARIALGRGRFEGPFPPCCFGDTARSQAGWNWISAISVWELASKPARGRIRRYGTLDSSLNLLLEDVIVLPITPQIAVLAARFPSDYSGDPADRIIGGTARAESLTLITQDEKIRRSPLLKTVW
jgi:PIN domain nuclease of toxin-antitoxin system